METGQLSPEGFRTRHVLFLGAGRTELVDEDTKKGLSNEIVTVFFWAGMNLSRPE